MLDGLPYRTFQEWQKYYELEPFGSERDNLHAAIVAQAIWQAAMDPKERHKIRLQDFLIGTAGAEPPPEEVKPTPTEIYQKMRLIAVGMGAGRPQ